MLQGGFAIVTRRGLAAALLGAFSLSLAGATVSAATSAVEVRITGSPEVRFEAVCRLHRGGGTEVARFAGQVPQRHRWRADEVVCRVTQTTAAGHLQVEIAKRGNRTVMRTEGKDSHVQVRVR